MTKYYSIILFALLLVSCDKKYPEQETKINSQRDSIKILQERLYRLSDSAVTLDSIFNLKGNELINKIELSKVHQDSFVNVKHLSSEFVFDIRYATNNNFLKEPVYDCGECYVRYKTALALLKANKEFMEKGFKLKFFDCYRPNSVQQKMWEIFPNPYYLSNPKKGSIHNKGGAVDISLVDLDGNPVDMGTDFDHFGEEAHHAYNDLPEEVLANRKLLRSVMEKYGFWTIRTEWWHYNYLGTSRNAIEDFYWDCD